MSIDCNVSEYENLDHKKKCVHELIDTHIKFINEQFEQIKKFRDTLRSFNEKTAEPLEKNIEKFQLTQRVFDKLYNNYKLEYRKKSINAISIGNNKCKNEIKCNKKYEEQYNNIKNTYELFENFFTNLLNEIEESSNNSNPTIAQVQTPPKPRTLTSTKNQVQKVHGIKILTYNINNEDSTAIQRYTNIANKLNNSGIDVLCLQEVISDNYTDNYNTTYSLVTKLTNDLSKYTLISGCSDWGQETNLIFCLNKYNATPLHIYKEYDRNQLNFPEKTNDAYGRFNKKTNDDYDKNDCIRTTDYNYINSCGGSRCFAGIELEYNNKKLYIYTSHLLPPFNNIINNNDDADKMDIFRLWQLHEIMKHYDDIKNENKIGIIAGDFNTTYKYLCDSYNKNKTDFKLFRKWNNLTNGIKKLTGRRKNSIIGNPRKSLNDKPIDIILGNGIIDKQVIKSSIHIELDETNYSDHAAVLVHVNIN